MNRHQVKLFLDYVAECAVRTDDGQPKRTNDGLSWKEHHKRNDKLTEACEYIGLKEIGGGSFKKVWGATGVKFVVKTMYNSEGANEVENAKTCPFELRPFLVPVTQGAGFQIQTRVKFHKCPKHGPYKCDGRVPECDDLDTRNHTHDADGRLRIFDYGQTYQWDKPVPKGAKPPKPIAVTSREEAAA